MWVGLSTQLALMKEVVPHRVGGPVHSAEGLTRKKSCLYTAILTPAQEPPAHLA